MKRVRIEDWPRELERQIAAIKPAIGLALKEIGATAEEIAKGKIGHYQAEIGGFGYAFPAWEPLAASTLAEKTRLGYAPPDNPLLRTGEMRESIATISSAFTVTIGSQNPIARFQELGTSRIPPRPFIGPAMLEVVPMAKAILGKALAATIGGETYRPARSIELVR